MLVCDGLQGAGCPSGALLDVELGPERVRRADLARVQQLLLPHGWQLGMREAVGAAAGMTFEPVCPTCGAALDDGGINGADDLSLETRSPLLQLAVPHAG